MDLRFRFYLVLPMHPRRENMSCVKSGPAAFRPYARCPAMATEIQDLQNG